MDSEENTPWQYKPDNGSAATDSQLPESSTSHINKSSAPKTIAWQASEYIDHVHGVGWYLMLVIATATIAAAVYLVSKDAIATGIIVIVGIIVGVFAGQKPKEAKYEIGSSGLSVNGKLYNYGDFKSFAVINEGPLSSLNLYPLKRLVPPVSAYFDPKDQQKIIETLGNYLPYEQRKLDGIDRLSRRLRL